MHVSGAGTYRAGVWPVLLVVVSFVFHLWGWEQGSLTSRCVSTRGWWWPGRKWGGGGDGRGGSGGGEVVMAGEEVGRRWWRVGERGWLGSGGRGGGVGGLAWVPSTCVETVSIPNV